MAEIDEPITDQMLVADGERVASGSFYANVAYEQTDIKARHNKKFIVGYADGHVELTSTYPMLVDPAISVTDLVLWFDASNAGSITKDGSNKVSAWNSFTSIGNATQGTAASQPVYTAAVADLNNQPALLFDGADDGLLTANVTSAWTTPEATMFVVFRPTADVRFNLIHQMNAYGDEYARNSDGNCYWGWFRTARIDGYPAINSVPDDAKCMITVVSGTGANSYTGYVNGVSAGARNPLWVTPDTFNIAGYGNNAGRFAGYIAEIIMYKKALDDGKRQEVESYLKSKYGL